LIQEIWSAFDFFIIQVPFLKGLHPFCARASVTAKFASDLLRPARRVRNPIFWPPNVFCSLLFVGVYFSDQLVSETQLAIFGSSLQKLRATEIPLTVLEAYF